MSVMTKLVYIFKLMKLPHTRFTADFMNENEEPLPFVGDLYRVENTPGFKDDRRRNIYGYVPYAPRKIIPDLLGGGVPVSEDYPQSEAAELFPDILEASTPRQTRGQKADTLTEVHDERTEFDVAVAAFADTPDSNPPDGIAAWSGSDNPTTQQPQNPFNARYPYNHVRETESGHLFETDDTPGSERIKESHRSGTYYEIGPDGSRTVKIVRDDFTVIVGEERVNIKGPATVTVEGDCNLYTKGNYTHQVDGDYNLLVKGKLTERVADSVAFDYHSDCGFVVGAAIDPSKAGQGRGNKGGSLSFTVTNDYLMKTGGSAVQVFGNPDLYDSDGTTVEYKQVIFGNKSNMVVGGFKYDQTEKDSTEIVGGSKYFNVVSNRESIIGGNDTDTITGNRTVFVGGLNTETIVGAYLLSACTTYTVASAGLATYTASAGMTQSVPGGTLQINTGITNMVSTGITTIEGLQVRLNP